MLPSLHFYILQYHHVKLVYHQYFVYLCRLLYSCHYVKTGVWADGCHFLPTPMENACDIWCHQFFTALHCAQVFKRQCLTFGQAKCGPEDSWDFLLELHFWPLWSKRYFSHESRLGQSASCFSSGYGEGRLHRHGQTQDILCIGFRGTPLHALSYRICSCHTPLG